MKVVAIKEPQLFRRYPCPSSSHILAGQVDVDLGHWIIADKDEQVHLRINCEELEALVEKVAKSNGRCVTLGLGTFSVFVVGRP